MKMVVAGSDCEKCLYFMPCENRAKVKCEARDREYYFGQRIPCEDRKDIKNGRTD